MGALAGRALVLPDIMADKVARRAEMTKWGLSLITLKVLCHIKNRSYMNLLWSSSYAREHVLTLYL